MIGKIKGLLEAKTTHQALIDVNGLCYELEVPISTAFDLPEKGEVVELYTHFVVREDAQLLYGFNSNLDRDTFRILIKVNGVGPKLGIAILSGLSARDLQSCVDQEDVSALVKLPGIGKKTAERLLIELRDKLKIVPEAVLAADVALPLEIAGSSGIEDEAEAALVALGYKPADAAKLVKKHYADGMSVQDLIK
ncbi:Holliday junction DNA helicase RuvA, partial [Oleiphilus sp. HI0130]